MWAPILASPEHYSELPRVHEKDAPTLLVMWNAAYLNGGERRAFLYTIAKRLGLDAAALKLIHQRDIEAQLAAFETLRDLGDRSAAPEVRAFVDSSNPVVSFAAARALLKIDHNFARTFVALMIKHSDWPPAELQELVEEERDTLATPILRLVRASSAMSRDLIQYLRFFDSTLTRPVLRHILTSADDPAILMEALKVLEAIGSPSEANRNPAKPVRPAV